MKSSVRPKHPFCRTVAEPKHQNVSAEPKQSSNVTIPPKREFYCSFNITSVDNDNLSNSEIFLIHSHFDSEFYYDFTVSGSAENFEIGRTETKPKFRPNFCFGRTLIISIFY